MSDKTPVVLVDDPYGQVNLRRNSDGSLSRLPPPLPDSPATPEPNPLSPVITKDFPINRSKNTYLRLFLPRDQPLDTTTTKKLPLITYLHAGGFVASLGVSFPPFHNFCATLAAGVPAAIASVEYRLAPEHRLPAAYEDAMEALLWIKNNAKEEEWFTKYVDLSNTYLMGTSSGANIAYNVALRITPIVDEFKPLKIKGLILHHPFFGGIQKTESELSLVKDELLPPHINDLLWELALPEGVDRDHEYCNLANGGGGEDVWDKIKLLKWKVGVTDYYGDPLIDRALRFAKMVEEKGVEVMKLFSEGGFHGVEIMDPSQAPLLVAFVQKFIISSSTLAD